MNTPMPIWIKPWMSRGSRLFDGYSIAVYYSSHERNELSVLGFETSTGMWNTLKTSLSFDTYKGCTSLHSPSIYASNSEKRFYMYLHGHGCPYSKSQSNSPWSQPTLMYTSEDGFQWNHVQQKNLFYSSTSVYFYSSTPVYNSRDGYFYIVSRINGEKGVVLHRSTSLFGPFEQGPQLGLGLRHFDLMLVEGIMFIFYSMIGDHPERVLLASIDTTFTANWTDWKLLPGPRILKPEYWYEHGNELIGPTNEGIARIRHKVRDPRFLPDLESNSKHISGLLFYSVQGEKGIAMARVTIDLALYAKLYPIEINLVSELMFFVHQVFFKKGKMRQ